MGHVRQGWLIPTSIHRLRQCDVKAGHFERKVQAQEQTISQLEKKIEDMEIQLKESKAELEKFAAELGAL
jgi:tropomyosin, fungi type